MKWITVSICDSGKHVAKPFQRCRMWIRRRSRYIRQGRRIFTESNLIFLRPCSFMTAPCNPVLNPTPDVPPLITYSSLSPSVSKSPSLLRMASSKAVSGRNEAGVNRTAGFSHRVGAACEAMSRACLRSPKAVTLASEL